MPNIYFAGFFAVLILAAAAGIYVKGGNDREAKITAMYQARDLKAAADYQAKETAIQNEYRKKETEWAGKSAAVSKKYQRELANAETSKLAALAAVDAGTLRLRLTDSAGCTPDRGSTAEIASAAGRRNGDTEGRFLGKADSAFLIAEASRADTIVERLTACQSALEADRR